MQNYQDKYSRYHHKPCINGEPSSNNGYIYTAYADKLGLPVNDLELQSCFNNCVNEHNTFILRSPGKGLPPMSRDEILGAAALRLLKARNLQGWSFSPRPIPRFNPIKLVAQLWEVRGKHRNYFWENNLDQLYSFAFSVPLTDRYFILSKWKRFNLLYWAIAKVDSIIGGSSGIRWLKYGKSKEAMLKEFPADHPFRGVK